MSVHEIQAFLAERYGTEMSPDFISSVIDEVMPALCHEPVCHPVRRAIHARAWLTIFSTISPTKMRTGSKKAFADFTSRLAPSMKSTVCPRSTAR